MLVVGFGKGMAARAVGDEEQIAGTRGIGRSFQRSPSGVGDRPGWQTVDYIGVVRRRLLDFRALDRAPQRSLAADQSIDDRRIGLQFYLLPQPVHEHRGDTAALVGLAGF